MQRFLRQSKKNLTSFATYLFASRKCLQCSEVNMEHNKLCFSCWDKLEFLDYNYCDSIYSVLKLNDLSKEIIHQAKYDSKYEYLEFMANIMVHYLHANNIEFDMVVPVPISDEKLSERKFSQTAILAKKINVIFAKELQLDYLRRHHSVSQTSLSLKQRRVNIAGKMFMNPKLSIDLSNKRVLLIDDVVTTGATIEEAEKVLYNSGALQVISFSFAKTFLT